MSTEIEIRKLTDRELVIVYKDKDKHTIPNLISKLALNKPHVKYAAYIIDHPLVSYPEIVIVTDGSRKPLDVLKEVLVEARDMLTNLLRKVDQVLTPEE